MNIRRKEISAHVALICLAVVFSLLLASTVYAGTLTSFTATPSTAHAGETSDHTIKFSTASSPTASSTQFSFPSGFGVSGIGPATTTITWGTATTTTATTSVSAQKVTLDLKASGITWQSTSTFSVTLTGIINHSDNGSYTITASTTTALGGGGSQIDSGTSVAFFIQKGATAVAADTTAPVSKILNPASGATIPAGQSYKIEGTGTDTGGSSITKVEVSVDGGQTWSQAKVSSSVSYSGASYNWSYVWANPADGEYTIKVRATDSKNNVESAGPSVKVTVGVGAPAAEQPAAAPETPAVPTTASELQAKLNELRQTLLNLLQQLVQLLQQQLQGLTGGGY